MSGRHVVLTVDPDAVHVRHGGGAVRRVALEAEPGDRLLRLEGPVSHAEVTATSVTATRRLVAVLDPTVTVARCVLEVQTSEHVARRRRARWAYATGEARAAWRPAGTVPGGPAVLRLERRLPGPRQLRRLLEEMLREVVPTPPQRASVAGAPPDAPVVDPWLLGPAGFTAAAPGPLVELCGDEEQVGLVAAGATVVSWSGARRPDDGDVARLRELRGCVVRWDDATGNGDAALSAGARVRLLECVAALACAGVPLAAPAPPRWAAPVLGEAVARALVDADPGAWADALRREEDSVRLRRAALRTFCPPPAREVSVLAATRRPEMVGHLLGEIGRQEDVRVEVLLSLHGLSSDHPDVVTALATHPEPVVVLEPEASTPFGTVLQQAAGAASCEVLSKMDDDDWYGERHLADMLLALHVSGADLVGCSPDFVHLETFGTTLRRSSRSETLTRFVAGGSLTLTRRTLTAVGGFRPVRGGEEDRGLLDDVLTDSGSVYRTHGLGYVLRRRSRGHTWQASSRFYLSLAHVQAAGLVGSREMGAGWEGAAASEGAVWREGLLAPRSSPASADGESLLASDLAGAGVGRLRLVVDGADELEPEVAVDVVAPGGGDGELLVDGARYGITTPP